MKKIGERKAQQVLSKSSQRSLSKTKAQQEMVGFVLIVVLVVIALMIFLVISARKPVQSTESAKIENLLSSVMRYTTDCAINSEPDFETVEDLIKSCYKNKECKNLEMPACDYLNSTMKNILTDLYNTESVYQGYDFSVVVSSKDSSERESMFQDSYGNCLGNSKTGAEKISLDSQMSVNIVLKFCD
jgi:hypothetical protein